MRLSHREQIDVIEVVKTSSFGIPYIIPGEVLKEFFWKLKFWKPFDAFSPLAANKLIFSGVLA